MDRIRLAVTADRLDRAFHVGQREVVVASFSRGYRPDSRSAIPFFISRNVRPRTPLIVSSFAKNQVGLEIGGRAVCGPATTTVPPIFARRIACCVAPGKCAVTLTTASTIFPPVISATAATTSLTALTSIA